MPEVKVICSAIVMKGKKFVLVKEAQPHVFGKWFFPAGHLELNENIFSATLREVREETNLTVKLTDLIGIYNYKSGRGNNVIQFVFQAKALKGKLKHAVPELLDARWFTLAEFQKLKDKELRTPLMRKVIKDTLSKRLFKIETIITGKF